MPVAGIGNDKAAKIWYRALAEYFTDKTNYATARVATLKAAAELFGAFSLEYNTVNAAWSAVSVGGSRSPENRRRIRSTRETRRPLSRRRSATRRVSIRRPARPMRTLTSWSTVGPRPHHETVRFSSSSRNRSTMPV